MSDASDAHAYRLRRAEQMLTAAGWWQHSDGQWYPEPEEPPED